MKNGTSYTCTRTAAYFIQRHLVNNKLAAALGTVDGIWCFGGLFRYIIWKL